MLRFLSRFRNSFTLLFRDTSASAPVPLSSAGTDSLWEQDRTATCRAKKCPISTTIRGQNGRKPRSGGIPSAPCPLPPLHPRARSGVRTGNELSTAQSTRGSEKRNGKPGRPIPGRQHIGHREAGPASSASGKPGPALLFLIAEQVDLAALDLAEHGSQLGHYRGDERQYVVDVFLPRLAAVGDAVRCG